MAAMGTISLAGKTGRKYEFTIYPIETQFYDVQAVYVFTHALSNGSGGYTHTLVYIGQTSALGTRLSSHHKWSCINGKGANRVCIMLIESELLRLSIEADLINNFNPNCNGS